MSDSEACVRRMERTARVCAFFVDCDIGGAADRDAHAMEAPERGWGPATRELHASFVLSSISVSVKSLSSVCASSSAFTRLAARRSLIAKSCAGA